MKTRRSTQTLDPKTVFIAGSAVMALTVLFVLPNPVEAKTRAESVSYGICEILLQNPPDQRMLAQIRARPDFAQILDFVEGNCSGGGELLVGPTNTIATPRDNRNGGNRVFTPPAGGGDPGGGGKEPPKEDPKEDPKEEGEKPDPKVK